MDDQALKELRRFPQIVYVFGPGTLVHEYQNTVLARLGEGRPQLWLDLRCGPQVAVAFAKTLMTALESLEQSLIITAIDTDLAERIGVGDSELDIAVFVPAIGKPVIANGKPSAMDVGPLWETPTALLILLDAAVRPYMRNPFEFRLVYVARDRTLVYLTPALIDQETAQALLGRQVDADDGKDVLVHWNSLCFNVVVEDRKIVSMRQLVGGTLFVGDELEVPDAQQRELVVDLLHKVPMLEALAVAECFHAGATLLVEDRSAHIYTPKKD